MVSAGWRILYTANSEARVRSVQRRSARIRRLESGHGHISPTRKILQSMMIANHTPAITRN